MTELHAVAAAGFGAAADVYERARPGYPDAAVAWLAERLRIGPGRDVLDLAAGTGKLTRSLVPLGARVVAVEPVEAMRAELERAVPEAEIRFGTAEAIPLETESVDAVLVAQAFHWFRVEEALAEIHRVLRPGGGLGLIWNSRDLADQLQAELDAVLAPLREGGWQQGGESEEALERSPLFGPVEHRTWPNEQRVTVEGLVDRVASTSFVAALEPAKREAVLERVRDAARRVAEPIVIPYVTDVFVGDRR